jgi:hypothetical protein
VKQKITRRAKMSQATLRTALSCCTLFADKVREMCAARPRERLFIKIKFGSCLTANGKRGNLRIPFPLELREKPERVQTMRKTALVLATVATLGVTAVAAPAEARGRFGYGFGPALAGGLIAGALFAGLASSAYAYGPGYGYYGGYAPAYYGGPAYYGYGYDYGYAPRSYGSPYYAAYYGYPRRVLRPAYAYYGGPRYYGGWGHRYRHW